MNLAGRFRVKPGKKVSLGRWDPDDTAGYEKGSKAEARLERFLGALDDLQYLLYAEKRHALLVVLQSMDAGGKDGTIRHVMATMNPQGCAVTAFKVPTPEEAAHDFLWRVHRAVPSRGEIGIFNRSHYEDVLAARVHHLAPRRVWSQRYEQINNFEKLLSENNVRILKFYLHITKAEQKKRLEARLDDPHKLWKLSNSDFEDRKLWKDYKKAYEDALELCSTPWAPWYIIPANKKWFRNLAVSEILVGALENLHMAFPKPAIERSKFKLK